MLSVFCWILGGILCAALTAAADPPVSTAGRLFAVDENFAQVNVPVGNLRTQPDITSAIIEKLTEGTAVTLKQKRGNWFVIELDDGRVGWAHQSLFQGGQHLRMKRPSHTNPAKATVSVNIGRIRAKPSLKARIQFGVKRGDGVSVIDTRDDWLLIESADHRVGYAHRLLFQDESSTSRLNASTRKRIHAIEFITTPEDKEMVLFSLEGYYPPEVFSETATHPIVICDFINHELDDGIDALIDAKGAFVQLIRVGIHKGSQPKIRVILDLTTGLDYDIRPVFFKNDNLFTLIVTKKD